MSKNVAVVGAGLAGLTAAAELVRAGAMVTLFERSGAIGGRASTLLKEGFYLNQGPHALYKSGAAYEMVRDFQIPISHGPSPRFKRAFALADGELHDLPLSMGTLVSTKVLSTTEKIELVSLISRVSAIPTGEVMSVTLDAWLTKNVSRKRVREVIEALVRLSSYSNNPGDISAGAAIRQLALALRGVVYLDKGWQTLVDGLHALCKPKMNEVLNAHVSRIRPNENGVELYVNEEVMPFDAAILALSPAQAEKIVGLNFTDSMQDVNVACLDVCLNKLPIEDNTFALGVDEPVYYSVHSSAAKLSEREAGAVVHAAYYLAPGETGGQLHHDRLTGLIDRIQPGWRDEVVYQRYLPQMVASFGFPAAMRNGCNGVSDAADAHLLSKMPNVCVCGDWVGSDYLLADAAVASARRAANAVLAPPAALQQMVTDQA